MKPCPVCAQGELERGTQLQTFRYKGKTLRYQQPGLWCSACGEGILTNADMNATERLLADFRASLDNYLTSAEVRRIRKKLGLTRKRAEEVFGGERQAFDRYESGVARPPRSIDTLLRLLDQHPELLHEISRRKAA
ncbi:MAG: type II toxin-antitoxin system MqsA family antitoxin [Terriglobia bacterium]